jgi:hypothetical protein
MVVATEASTQETTATDTSATSRIEGPQVKKIRQSKMLNQTIRFARRQLQLLVTSMS